MGFKLLKGNHLELRPLFIMPGYQPDNNEYEFCFQFGDDEPVVFASSSNEMILRLTPSMGVNGAYIAFNNNSNVFKIFARELR
jgi:hypothetical protein